MSTQSEKLTAIANAIRAKEGSSDPIPANDFPARIAAIETGTQLPTLTNPGAASDLASGKQLIGQDGEIVTGTILERVSGASVASPGNSFYTAMSGSSLVEIGVQKNITQDVILRSGSEYTQYLSASQFGNATAADVAAGKTFTSTEGVKVTGTGSLLNPYCVLSGLSGEIVTSLQETALGSIGTITITESANGSYSGGLAVFPDYNTQLTYPATVTNMFAVTGVLILPSGNNYRLFCLGNYNNFNYSRWLTSASVVYENHVWTITIPDDGSYQARFPSTFEQFQCASFNITGS